MNAQQEAPGVDHRDGVIEELVDSEADLLDRIVDLTTECQSYRLVAKQAVEALHELTVDRDRLRDRYHHLLAQFRALRDDLAGRHRRAA